MSTRDEFTSLKPQRLSDSTVDQVVQLVRDGRLAPGAQLPSEREMVDLLGVSRTSYREAVRILETMGILQVVSGRGTWVREPPAWVAKDMGMGWLAKHENDVFQLLELRDALDTKAVALAARRGTDHDTGAIRDRLEELKTAVLRADVDAIVEADTAFHIAVAKASGNALLEEAITSLYESLSETRRAMISIPGRLRRFDEEHRTLLEAILSHDPDRAARTMAGHESRVEHEISIAIHGEEFLK